MRKKILDAAILTGFCVGLSVTSNIQENVVYTAYVAEVETEKEEETPALEESETKPEQKQEEKLMPGAGVALAISANSFTTESDEETGIEKKDVTLVTSSDHPFLRL